MRQGRLGRTVSRAGMEAWVDASAGFVRLDAQVGSNVGQSVRFGSKSGPRKLAQILAAAASMAAISSP